MEYSPENSGKYVNIWNVLRDDSLDIIRDSLIAVERISELEKRNSISNGEIIIEIDNNSKTSESREAMDQFFQGVTKYHIKEYSSAIESFANAKKADTTLVYYSEINLWISAAYSKMGYKDTSEKYYEEFKNKSEGLCPRSSRVPNCENPEAYRSAIENVEKGISILDDPTYYAYNYLYTPFDRQQSYGFLRQREGSERGSIGVGLGYIQGNGFAQLLDISMYEWHRIEPRIFIGLDRNDFLWGAGYSIKLINTKYNRFNVIGKYNFIQYKSRDTLDEYTLNQNMVGFEASVYLNKNILMFAGYNFYHYNGENPYTYNESGESKDVSNGNYYNLGATYYLGSIGMTCRYIKKDSQIGLQFGSGFIGYGINSKSISITTKLTEDLFR